MNQANRQVLLGGELHIPPPVYLLSPNSKYFRMQPYLEMANEDGINQDEVIRVDPNSM